MFTSFPKFILYNFKDIISLYIFIIIFIVDQQICKISLDRLIDWFNKISKN